MNSEPKLHRVFVYGTLMRDHGNHYFLHNAEFIGTGKTKERYCMRINNGLPYVLRHLELSQICGEVYLVGDITLAELDRLESHPNWYRREEVEILLNRNTGIPEAITAWVYFNPDGVGSDVPSGIYR